MQTSMFMFGQSQRAFFAGLRRVHIRRWLNHKPSSLPLCEGGAVAFGHVSAAGMIGRSYERKHYPVSEGDVCPNCLREARNREAAFKEVIG